MKTFQDYYNEFKPLKEPTLEDLYETKPDVLYRLIDECLFSVKAQSFCSQLKKVDYQKVNQILSSVLKDRLGLTKDDLSQFIGLYGDLLKDRRISFRQGLAEDTPLEVVDYYREALENNYSLSERYSYALDRNLYELAEFYLDDIIDGEFFDYYSRLVGDLEYLQRLKGSEEPEVKNYLKKIVEPLQKEVELIFLATLKNQWPPGIRKLIRSKRSRNLAWKLAKDLGDRKGNQKLYQTIREQIGQALEEEEKERYQQRVRFQLDPILVPDIANLVEGYLEE